MSKIIKLPCCGIEVDLDKQTIVSKLKEGSNLGEEDIAFNAAMDALESMILAHALAGVDIEAPAYLEGIDTAIDAIENNL